MALVLDTSVIYAALDRRDSAHPACRDLLEAAVDELVIPSPVLPEADYLLQKFLGAGAAIGLLRDVLAGAFRVDDLLEDDYRRAVELMDRYADASVGFVDAAVLAVVERLGESKLATLDRRHFTILRPRHVDALELLP